MKLKEYFNKVASLGCCICRGHATIHHVHSGSCVEAGIVRGGGQKTSDWFVIPLCFHHHVGDAGIDNNIGVETWEQTYGTQVSFLRWVQQQTGIDPWEMVKRDAPVLPKILPRR